MDPVTTIGLGDIDWVRELEECLRIVGLRLAIEGEDASADVRETLERLAVAINERLR